VKAAVQKLPYAVFFLLAGAMLLYAFWPPAIEVDLVTVSRGPLEVVIREDGRTRVKERYVVSAPLGGELLRVSLHPGDRVVAGETLIAVIEPGDPALLDVRTRAELEARAKAAEARQMHAQTQLERAQKTYDFSKSQHARSEQLLSQKAVSREEYDQAVLELRITADDVQAAEFAVKIAEFESQQAQAALIRTREIPQAADNRLEIRSPIGGEVLRVFQESAGLLTAGSPLVELGDRTEMEVEVDVLSSDAVRITPGAKMYLEHWGSPAPLLARVRLIEPQAFLKVSALGVEEQRVNVIADFTDPFEVRQRLGDAYRVEAGIVIWSAESVVKCGAGAFFRHDGSWAAYRVVKGQARLTSVDLGQSSGRETEVLRGLSENDVLIAYPSDQIHEGVRVQQRSARR